MFNRTSIVAVASFLVAPAVALAGAKEDVQAAAKKLADAPNYYTTVPLLMLWPGLALVFTTLAFNLLGDGLRDAFDPRSRL